MENITTSQEGDSPMLERDVVVAFADEVEYQRFVVRRGAYSGQSKRPSTLVFSQNGHCDMAKADERNLRKENLTNRSIWIRNSDPNSGAKPFICAVQSAKDCGGLLFAKIYNSELQLRANRLHEAFLALGLKRWHIEVEETSFESTHAEKNGKASGGMGISKKNKIGQIEDVMDADGGTDVSGLLAKEFEETLRQNIDVEFNEGWGQEIDPVKVDAKVKSLGLDRDPIISAVMEARRRGTPITTMSHDLNFSFAGEIERKLDLAFNIAVKILFVFRAHLNGEYHSFNKDVEKVKNSVKIYVED